MLSSSLNRRKQPIRTPSRHLRMRWHRYVHAVMASPSGEKGGTPSRLLLWKQGRFHALRTAPHDPNRL